MLVRFAASNIRSINERQELSMVPSAFFKEHPEVLLSCDAVPSQNLLPAAVIYGANAAGKTNIVAAVKYLQDAVLNSHKEGNPKGGVPRQPFALKKSCIKQPTAIEIEFVSDGTRYQYGFEADSEAFKSEWLFSFPRRHRQMLFDRTGEKKIKFGRTLKGQNRVISDIMRPNSLFLSAAAQNGHKQLSRIHSYVSSLKFETTGSNPPEVFLFKEEFDRRIVDFLKQVGTGIIGFRTKKRSRTKEEIGFERDIFKLVSRYVKSKIQDKEEVEFPNFSNLNELELAHPSEVEPTYFGVDKESAGTRRLLYILASVFTALDNGSVLFIDELDASLHTQICELILGLFASRSKNPKGAQLIATTHDTNLMRSQYLRRDQLWFTEKDQFGATHLFPLTDIRTRKTDNIEKGYLQGRYGAIPFSGTLVDLLED